MPNPRMYNHKHNSLIGSAIRSKQDFRRITSAPSASNIAKGLAERILVLQSRLAFELSTYRVDSDGVCRRMKKDRK